MLHETVERLKESEIARNGAVKDDVDRVDECRRRRILGLRQRINLYALAVCHRLGHVRVAAARKVGAQQGVALVGLRLQYDVALRRIARVSRRQDQIFAALAFVDAGRADIFQRSLPTIVDASGDRAVGSSRRNLHHHRSDVLRIEQRHPEAVRSRRRVEISQRAVI